MKHPRAWALVTSLVHLVCAVLFSKYVAFIGLPDGYVDQLGRAHKSLFTIVSRECFVVGAVFLLLALMPGSNRSKAVKTLLLVQTGFLLFAEAINLYYGHIFYLYMVG